MAKQERELSEEERKIARGVEDALSRIPRRTFLVRSGQVGAAAVGAAAVAAGVVAYNFGVTNGAQDERGRIFPRGELSPELLAKLAAKEHSVVKIQGWTAASLRDFDPTVPDFPFQIPEGEDGPENTPSKYRWLAVGPGGVYLPLREGDDTVGDFSGAVSRANTAAGQIDSKLGFKQGDLSDFIEADVEFRRKTGQTIFQAGHVVTSHQVEIDGVTNGIAIGRSAPSAPLSFITFDASREAPLPAGVSAGGFVVAK